MKATLVFTRRYCRDLAHGSLRFVSRSEYFPLLLLVEFQFASQVKWPANVADYLKERRPQVAVDENGG